MRIGELEFSRSEIVKEGFVLKLKDPEYILNFELDCKICFEIYNGNTWLARSSISKVTRIDRKEGTICTDNDNEISSGINEIAFHFKVYIRLADK